MKAFKELLPHMDSRKKRFLEVLMGMPNHTASSRQLLQRLEVRDYIVAYKTIGQLGKHTGSR